MANTLLKLRNKTLNWGQLVFVKVHNTYNFNHLKELFGSRRLHQMNEPHPCGGAFLFVGDGVDESPRCGLTARNGAVRRFGNAGNAGAIPSASQTL